MLSLQHDILGVRTRSFVNAGGTYQRWRKHPPKILHWDNSLDLPLLSRSLADKSFTIQTFKPYNASRLGAEDFERWTVVDASAVEEADGYRSSCDDNDGNEEGRWRRYESRVKDEER